MKRRAVVVAAALLGACSVLTDLDGFTGGGSASPDGAPPSTDVDAGAPVGDAGAPLEASVIPGVDAGFDAATFTCPTAAIAICETFDRDAEEGGWSVTAQGGAAIGRKDFLGQPALVTSVPAKESGNPPVAFWHRSFERTVSKLSFDADMAYDNRTAASPEYHVLFQVRLQHGESFNLLYVTVPSDGNGFALQEFKPTPGQLDYRVIDIPPGGVRHVHWDVEIGGRTHFDIDGKQVVDIATPPYVSAGQPTVLLGVVLSEVPTTPIELALDNVVFLAD
ncbi:MAG: hypothetical protein KIT84_09530 [Labilithrix sp.]|nr:hypothetical protein [Labilithrix sp.]MCW5811241.1 hypothetical protein [Labilithrix sp.]